MGEFSKIANQLVVEPVCSHCHHNREDARRA